MKQHLLKSAMALLLCSALFSFARVGGDSYTIHLNGKQIIQHYVYSKNELPKLTLTAAGSRDQLMVFYSECGNIGKSRRLSITDEHGAVLKEWRFADVTDEHVPMACVVNDILNVKKPGISTMKLVYTSREVSKGQVLATVLVAPAVTTVRNQ
jgi:hypothetical protein